MLFSSPILSAASGPLESAPVRRDSLAVRAQFPQDSARLAKRLIELRKENRELAAYPVENHGFTEATSWVDEFQGILRLIEDNLRLKTGKVTN
jgi:hypothetical protein